MRFRTRPLLDPNDAPGAGAPSAAPAQPTPAQPAPAAQPTQAAQPPQVTAPTTATSPAPSAPLFDEQRIQAQLAAIRTEEFLRGVENTTKSLEQRLAQLETTATAPRPVAPTDVPDDIDPEIANNPAFKKLRALEEQNNKLIKGFEHLMQTQEAERAAREQAQKQSQRQTVATQARTEVNKWLTDVVFARDPEIATNPLAQIVLKQQADHWLANEFDPDIDINSQYLELQRSMSQTYNKVKGLVATAPSSPREAAIVTDNAARNNVSSPGASPVGNPAAAAAPAPNILKPAGMRDALRRAAAARGVTSVNGVPLV